MKTCDYCGEFPGKIIKSVSGIDGIKNWNVCVTCDMIIDNQTLLSLSLILKDIRQKQNKNTKDIDKLINRLEKEIQMLAREAGMELFTAKIDTNV